ncbi:hypothetical protein LTR62_001870 [Meristemomyces frigidus]|uniref:WSC domain-containing protein n=1 Tax=Meristemomyces frigidus TaxID=1508187 RepID=A0AAN7TJI6_9PEZI|nr:hypothetical protein LTR62_001870 [Meristemomyces frigidus]
MKHLLSCLALGLSMLPRSDAFWRLNCGIIQSGRIDPLVNFGTVSAHAHTITGGSNIGVNSTAADMVNSECTSCEVFADKSAYWTPLLYYWYPNGSFFEVPHGGSVVYYLGRGPNAPNIETIPVGLQILSGNKAARSYDNETLTYGDAQYPGRPIADRVSFTCIVANGVTPAANQPYMFNVTQCVNGMRAQIAFQSCWDGVHLYKPDNSHMAYQSGIDNGICPPNYPHQLPIIFVETDYAIADVPEGIDDSRFVFSQGDPTGFGFHGDFINGWDPEVLQEAVDTCLYNGAPDGVIQECPILNQYDTTGASVNCPERPLQVNESVHGLLDALPGCVEVTYGPGSATAAQMECNKTVPLPYITPTPFGTALPTAIPTPNQPYGLPGFEYLGCYNDTGPGGGYRTLNSLQYSNYSFMTVEFCQQYCTEKGYQYAGVEYAQECHCDNNLNPTAQLPAPNSIHECRWNCGGTLTEGGTQEFCGGLGYIDVYNNTNSSFVPFGDDSQTAGNAQSYTPPAGFASNYLGCLSDGVNGRALGGAQVSWNNMSVEICGQYCSTAPNNNGGEGYQFYGLEFYTQCFCGNSIEGNNTFLTPFSTPTNDTCQARCKGKEPEICGGSNAISLYNNTAYAPPAIKSSVGRFDSQACLTDPGTNGRPLQPERYVNANMTVELCIKHCLGLYYHYAGIEYGDECYCGNSIVASSGGVIEACDSTKQKLCPGNQAE